MRVPGKRIIQLLLGAMALLALGGIGAAIGVYFAVLRDLPDFETLADYRPPLTSVVLDRGGIPVGHFFEERRRLTPLDEVPEIVIQAFLAAEDGTFYEHKGVDYKSIVRAAWANLRAGGQTVQGASTITQQMVKQLLLSSEQTYTRKLRELFLARRIEQRFSKDEILYLYLNQIYFGSGAYGIGEAAWTYFGKPIGSVSVSEAALLGGLPKAPGRHSPFLRPERAERRRQYVLDRMREEGFIDQASYDAAVAAPPVLASQEPPADFVAAAYLTEEVRKVLVEALGNDAVLHGGLQVETTVDIGLQRAAVDSMRTGLEALDHRRGYRGPLRRVTPDALPAELERLAEENDLPLEGSEPAATLAAADVRPLLGVVTVVDDGGKRARVAFAPGVEAELPFDDVSWARRVDASSGRAPKKMSQVLAEGDVARFRVTGGEELKANLYQRPEAQGALLSFEIPSGDVLALVGGYDFDQSEFNRATQALRQPGSAFKPLVYAAALGREYTPASIIYDRPVVYEDRETGFVWRPENYGRRFLGALTLSEALARSVNNATIHLLQDVGIDYVMEFTRRLGIESPLERNLGLALGSNPMTLLEITRAYAVFAAQGHRVLPSFIRRVRNQDGEILLENVVLGRRAEGSATEDVAAAGEDENGDDLETAATPEIWPKSDQDQDALFDGLQEGQVMPATQAYLSATLLRSVVEHKRGTGRRARSLGKPVAGKTGTTNDQGDAWFVGFSPDVVTGVWVGHDEKRVLGRGETGGRAAAPIWIEFMGSALAERPARDFPVPEGIVFARIDDRTGLLASSSSESSSFQAFLAGTAPRERAETAARPSERNLQLDF